MAEETDERYDMPPSLTRSGDRSAILSSKPDVSGPSGPEYFSGARLFGVQGDITDAFVRCMSVEADVVNSWQSPINYDRHARVAHTDGRSGQSSPDLSACVWIPLCCWPVQGAFTWAFQRFDGRNGRRSALSGRAGPVVTAGVGS